MTESFSARLRAATWSDHERAAENTYVHRLVRGELSRAQYAELVLQHLAIYRALEAAVDEHADDALIAPFHTPALARVAALEADRAALGTDALSAKVLAATADYVARIELVRNDPARVVAHHYTRYLGDLSGGLFIGKAVARAFGDDVAAFYRFPGIDDPKALKERYREALDVTPFGAEGEAALIDETLIAYDHNTRVLAALTELVREERVAS